jgi:hypothetical protein
VYSIRRFSVYGISEVVHANMEKHFVGEEFADLLKDEDKA